MPSHRVPAERPTDLFDSIPIGIVRLTAEGHVASANPAAERLLGARGPLAGSVLSAASAFAGTPAPAAIDATLADRQPRHLPPLAVHVGASDPPRELSLDLEPVPEGLLILLHDASAWSEEIDRARLFYQSFLHSHEAMEVTDRAGIIVDVNPAFERIYGYSRADTVGRKPRLVRSPKTSPEVYRSMWIALLDPHLGRWSGEIINLDREGQEHPVLLTINAIRDPAGTITHFIGVATDLTEQRAIERQLARADRLASLGQLSAGVAHELNTPLANILLMAESIGRRSTDPWLTERAAAIGRQVDQASRIVKGLLDFSRDRPVQAGDIDLVLVAREALDFARGKLSPELVIQDHTEGRRLPVHADKGQLSQVFVNLINNASDAMEGRGTLTLTCGSDAETAWVAVTDDGPGIPEEVLPHIFEPFFTTKTEGKGTGLGLAIVHGIVQSHGGHVDLRTDPGRGTTVTVRLPHRPTTRAAGAAT
jgi:two-component system cell cycle sensor histidine kinase/response regulator CckA